MPICSKCSIEKAETPLRGSAGNDRPALMMAGQGGERMSEKEQQIGKVIADALPHMSDFDKGYILAKAESAMERHKAEEREENEEPDNG